MKVKWFILFWALLILPTMSVSAAPTSTIIKLDHISDEALQMVKLRRYDDAEKLLEYFSDQFLSRTGKERMFSMDELRIITVAHSDALDATKNAGIPHNEKMNRVTKFRLVVDAISSGHQPLWTEMEEPIMASFQNVKQAVNSGNNVNFQSNFNSFLSLYNMIYPSLKIDIPAEQIQSLDAKVNYIDQSRPTLLSKSADHQELEALGNDLQTIFDEMTADEADPSLWWVIISTGSIIILTLSYVGWRKYRGDQELEKNRPKKLKD
ncbi:sporulation protein YpjB [Bacillus sp. 1NLA3E]|uniref:sporulation protein YpjB n=1 Tax=Bacillus sp. 1NLA3E TaxID=666686 RepID=UPI000247E2FF|nr:sporulation protein YpjB [Bacillus sp. 1NLA3E]AGK54691.1 sporulation protein YpjB [Bacillus sp. 1NLA3E]